MSYCEIGCECRRCKEAKQKRISENLRAKQNKKESWERISPLKGKMVFIPTKKGGD